MEVRHQEIARCLFRESNDALFIFDPRDHRVVDVNPATLRLTGFEKGAICALRLRDLFTSAEPEGLDRLVDAYRRTGFYHSREGYFLGRESAEPIPVNVSVSRIHTTPDPLGLVVARDITHRLRAQQALRASENRFRSLVETAQVIIWSVSADGRITALNPAFEVITGWPCATWIGRHFDDLIEPTDLPVATASFKRALRSESLPPFELHLRAAGGGSVPVEVLSAARQPDGDRDSVSGIARDLTERKLAEEAIRHAESMRQAKEAAEAADQAKSAFLGNISHEIRTPMTAILGFTDILLEDERVRALPPDLIENLRTIQQNGGHLLDLINDLLDLTKIEQDKLRIDREPCSPAQILSNVAALMRPRAEAKGLALVVEPDIALPAIIQTDAVRLRQILINLLSNAIKFTRQGGVRLQARFDPAPCAGADSIIRFDAIDTGIGMSESELEVLFEPFYTSETRTTPESGVGLGLAISRRLSERLGGRLTVVSKPGEGSTFTLTLPVGPTVPVEPVPTPASRCAAAEPAPLSSDPPGLLGGRVLLAEDNPSIQRFIALRLQQSGTEVVVANNGQQAVDYALEARAAGRPFDWILMDVQMPVLDGYEATRQLRSQGLRGPIIALTAYAIPSQRSESLRFGCDDLVTKPVDWNHLIDVLNAHRQQSRATSGAYSPVVGETLH